MKDEGGPWSVYFVQNKGQMMDKTRTEPEAESLSRQKKKVINHIHDSRNL